MGIVRLILNLALLASVCLAQQQRCPRVCRCSSADSADSTESEIADFSTGFSVSCDGVEMASLESNFISSIPRTATKLTLRNNGLTTLKPKIFKRFHMLNHLDLSGNDIEFLVPEVFEGLTELKILNMSVNKLQNIAPVGSDRAVFNSLSKLEVLDLSANPIQFVPEKALKQLKSLRFLDLAVKNLKCDCNLKWIVGWLNNRGVVVSNDSVCSEPKKLRGVRLDQLKKKQLVCKRTEDVVVVEQQPQQNESQLQPDVLLLEPPNPQVVFAGDRLVLKCQLSSQTASDATLEWLLNNVPIVSQLPNLNISEQRAQFSVTSHLTVIKLEQKHTGSWKCTKAFGPQTLFKLIDVVVMPHDTSEADDVKRNSTLIASCAVENEERDDTTGMWKWPETRAGKTVSFPCFHSGSVMGQLKWTATEVYLDRFSRRRVPLVYRECLVDGIWSISNSSACDSIMPTWKSFVKVYSVRATPHVFEELLVDLMELVQKSISAELFDIHSVQFVIGYLERISNQLGQVPVTSIYGVKSLVLKILDSVIFSDEMLIEAGSKFNMTNSIFSSLSHISQISPTTPLEFNGKNLQYTEMLLEFKSLDHVSQGEFVIVSLSRNSSKFQLSVEQSKKKRSVTTAELEEQPLVSLRIPKSALRNLTFTKSHQPKLSLTWVSRCSITPGFSELPGGPVEFFPFDGVFGVHASWADEKNFANQIVGLSTIALTTSVPTESVLPAVWRSSSTTGQWDISRCSLLNRTEQNQSIFSCSQSGFVTILQKLSEIQVAKMAGGLQLFPWMFGATGLLVICLIACIWTYTSCASSVHVFDGLRHCLLNSWICLALLVPMFTVGINLVYWEFVCLGLGIAIHYFLICSLFWMLLIIKAVHFKLWTSVSPPVPSGSDEDLPSSSQKASTNLAGTYLVGYGVGLTVCCFSVALSMSEYTETKYYCFLSPGATFIGAVAVPCGILLAIAVFLLLHGICLASALASSSRNSVDQQMVNRGDSRISAPDQLDTSVHTSTYRPNDSDCVGETKDGEPVELVTLFPTSRRGSVTSDKRQPNGLQNRRAPLNGRRASMVESNHEKISVRMVYLTVDEELGAGRQLALAGLFLLLFCLLVASAVLYIARPPFLADLIPHYLLVVSGGFCGSAVLLALFVLFAHAICRPSVRHRWSQCTAGICRNGRGWRSSDETPQVLTSQDELAIAETVRLRTTSAYEQAAAEFDGRLSSTRSQHSKREFYPNTGRYGASGPSKKNIGVIRRTPTKVKSQLGGEMILRSPTFENYPTMDSASSWAPPTSVTEGQEEIDEVLLQPKLQKLAARKYYEKQRQWRESQRDGSRNSYNGSHFSHPGELILEAVVDTEVEEEELMRLREGDEDDIDPAEISTAYLLSRRQMTQDSYELDEVFLQARQHPRKTKTERKSSRGDATSDDQRVSDSSSRTSSQARRRQQQPHRGDPHLRLYSTNDIHAKVPKVRLYRNTSDSAVPATLISQPISNGHSEITEETPLGSLEVKNSKVRRDLMFNGDFNGNDKSEDIQQEGEEAETDMLSSTSSQHGSVQELNRDDQISPVDSHSSKGLKSETCV